MYRSIKWLYKDYFWPYFEICYLQSRFLLVNCWIVLTDSRFTGDLHVIKNTASIFWACSIIEYIASIIWNFVFSHCLGIINLGFFNIIPICVNIVLNLINLLMFFSVGYNLQFSFSSSSMMLHLWSTNVSLSVMSQLSQYIWVPRSLAAAHTWLHDFAFYNIFKIKTCYQQHLINNFFRILFILKKFLENNLTLLKHHSSQECQTLPSINSPVALSILPHSAGPLLFPSFAKVVHILGPTITEIILGF